MEINPNFSANARKDLELVESAKRGNQKSYAELMGRYKDSIYFTALKMINNKDDAMDITVETFGRAFKNLDKYNTSYSFSTWLFRIATNNCIDFLRKKKLQIISINEIGEGNGDEEFQIRSDALNAEEKSIKEQNNELLKNIIEKLPSRYRILISMRYYDELSCEQISSLLDIPLGTIKGRLYRARFLMLNILNREQEFTL
jgi:RNA polymerase sigma-70 factor (ECF subfamily)